MHTISNSKCIYHLFKFQQQISGWKIFLKGQQAIKTDMESWVSNTIRLRNAGVLSSQFWYTIVQQLYSQLYTWNQFVLYDKQFLIVEQRSTNFFCQSQISKICAHWGRDVCISLWWMNLRVGYYPWQIWLKTCSNS